MSQIYDTANFNNIALLQKEAIDLLKTLIATPSFSKEEDKTADTIIEFLQARKIKTEQLKNNVWAINLHFDINKPTLLLNSHHDTVKPNKGYTVDPFDPFDPLAPLSAIPFIPFPPISDPINLVTCACGACV